MVYLVLGSRKEILFLSLSPCPSFSVPLSLFPRPHPPPRSSLSLSHSFHAGSIAFGALIIALVQLARVILAYVQKKLKGKAAEVLLCLLQCCLWCFEKS
jgi:hypothetical protein